MKHSILTLTALPIAHRTKRNRTYHSLLLAALVLLAGCRKDKPERPADQPLVVGTEGGVYITSEGNYGWGNAKVSFYDIASGNVVDDLFEPANGMALGDVCQSMRLFNNKAYVVVNNSNKVEVVDPSTFVVTATITGFNAPRYFLPVSNSKAYVTDLYANSIAVVDLNSNTITGSIPCRGWTEELVLAYGKAFVTNKSRNKVYVVDTATDQLSDSIVVGPGGNSIVADANGKLWVMCSGGTPALFRIDPATHLVEQSFPFPSGSDSPWRLSINSSNDVLYYLNDDVFRMSITASELPTAPFIDASGRNLYGLGIEPGSGVVYVADAIDHIQRGRIIRYATDGSLINSFLVGVAPSGLFFQ